MSSSKKSFNNQKKGNHKRTTKKRIIGNYSQESLKQVLHEIRENKLPIREASKRFGIPRTTIQDRINGRAQDNIKKTGPEPLLTNEGEAKIVQWIKNMAKCGFPLKKSDLMETVTNVLKYLKRELLFKNGKPGQKWYQNFLKRHPNIVLREAESLNKARAIVTEESIRLWFSDLQKFLKENNLIDIFEDPDRVLNCDEAGFNLCPKTGKGLAPKGIRNVYTVKMGNEKENITVLMTFTASGKVCPPLVVFPYVRPPRTVVDSMPKTWVLGRSDTGWMKGEVFFEYIFNDFLKWLNNQNIKRPVILFLDGHKSHMTMAISEFCELNKIILYALPANTTHILQPADVSVFRPMKQGWKDTIRKWQNKPENINCSVTKVNFCSLFDETLRSHEMTTAIINGLKKCGLFPLDPNNVDYTKCVKNIIERVNQTDDLLNEKITSSDIKIAEKVIKNIEPKLFSHGINVDVIYNELKYLENSQVKGREDDSINKENSLVGSIVNLSNVEIIDENDFQIIIADQTPSGHQEDIMHLETDNLLIQDDLLKKDSVLQEISENRSISPRMNFKEKSLALTAKDMNVPDNNILENQLYSDCFEQESILASKNITKENNKLKISEDIIIDSPKEIEETESNSILDPFSKHFTYPFPLPVSKTSKSKEKEKLPSAITSQKWRQYYLNKENIKKTKAEKTKKKSKNSLTASQISEQTVVEQKSGSIKKKVLCSAFNSELDSDTENDEDKHT